MTDVKKREFVESLGIPPMFDEAIRDVLDRPFEPDEVKQKKVDYDDGKKSFTCDYVDHATVTKRLNEAFGHAWSFDPVEHYFIDDVVVVFGRLKVMIDGVEIVKGQYGNNDSGEFISNPGDKLKAAASDCLKKCATLFGVGLQLYDKETVSGAASANGSLPQGWIVSKHDTYPGKECPVCQEPVKAGNGYYNMTGKVAVHKPCLSVYLTRDSDAPEFGSKKGQNSSIANQEPIPDSFTPPEERKTTEKGSKSDGETKTPPQTTSDTPRPNKGSGACRFCGEIVQAGAGLARRIDGGRMFIYHPGCEEVENEGGEAQTELAVDDGSKATDDLPF